ncbi:toll-like receptor Tollo [Macrobrachium rosenbergii]|uniref:toll-like receptor Tollo n=1 Tax=Macrobrachium rosenbergii TaxID=79674 RepID=UPI0034D59284
MADQHRWKQASFLCRLLLSLSLLSSKTSSQTTSSTSSSSSTTSAVGVSGSSFSSLSFSDYLSNLPSPANDSSKSSPACLWTSANVLECQVRILDDDLGIQISSGQWEDLETSSYPRSWQGRTDSRKLRSLMVECSQVLYYQSRITSSTFQGLEELEELAIRRCKLDSLPPGSLSGLRRLRELEITTHNGDWAALAMDVVEGSLPSYLERVSLAHNNIWTMPPMALCGRSLSHLDLASNHLHDIHVLGYAGQVHPFVSSLNISSTSFHLQEVYVTGDSREYLESDCGQALQELILDFNDLVRLPTGGFRVLTGLRELHIRNNDIRLISSEAFEGLKALQKLYLSNNHIIALQNGTFHGNSQLEGLYLNNNSLSSLSSGVFLGLKELQVLDISRNKLCFDDDEEDLFKNLHRLVVLNLSHNYFSRIPSHLLSDLTSLQQLDLSHNLLSNLNTESLNFLSNLYSLDLSSNHIHSVMEISLRGLVGLSILDLTNNSIANIHPNALHHSSNLKEVYLGVNQLQSIPGALQNLSFLKTMDITKNEIVSIQPFLFRNLRNLEHLDISVNKLNGLSEGSFNGLSNLQTLNLSNNYIRTLSVGSFNGIPNIKTIIVSKNELNDINGIFAGLEHLEVLDLSENNIKMFDYAFIPRLLIKLILKRNRIQKLGNFFKVHGILTLEVIDASHNTIQKLTEVSLPNTIKEVILHDNEISVILPNTFRDKNALQVLDIRMNSLRKLDPQSVSVRAMAGSQVRAQLSLSGNPLHCDCEMEWLFGSSGIPQTTSGATEVTFLQPRVNDLALVTCTLAHSHKGSTVLTRVLETTPENYLCPYDTHCFAICHCCDFIACDCQMKCPSECLCFHDDTWSINLVDCSGGNLNQLPDKVPMDATIVLLDGNNFEVLHAHPFIGRHSMQQLFLNNSQIKTLHNRTFHGLTSLRSLHLQDNMIVHLKGFEFSGLGQLKELYLQNNRLSFINNATFVDLESLEILRLDNNFIIDFPVWQLSKNVFLTQVSIGNNPWNCDCRFVESLREWGSQTSNLLLDPESVFCVQSSSGVVAAGIILPGFSCTKSHHSVMKYQFGQQELPFLAGSLCGGIALISALVVAAMLIARRSASTTSKLGINDSQNYCQEEDGKVFDAYISYSANDANFVRDILATKLENSCPSYKLCLHSRDFTENSRLSEFISQSISFSRRTIIILSKNYIDNEWKNAIFKKAHTDNLKEIDMNVIAVYHDGVSYSSFDADLKSVLKSSTKIYWGDKHFWKKLKNSMPQKQTYTNIPVYMSNNAYKSTMPSSITQPALIMPSSSSVLTSTSGLTTPSDMSRKPCYQQENIEAYNSPPPPRPCYASPLPCDYIVMQGQECNDPQCPCHNHSSNACAFTNGDSSSLHTYSSLDAFADKLPQPSSLENFSSRATSPSSNHYSVIDVPIRRTVRASKKKKKPQCQNDHPAGSEDLEDSIKDQNQSGTFRRTKSLRISKRSNLCSADAQMDYSCEGHADSKIASKNTNVIMDTNDLYIGLADSPPEPTTLSEECFV